MTFKWGGKILEEQDFCQIDGQIVLGNNQQFMEMWIFHESSIYTSILSDQIHSYNEYIDFSDVLCARSLF